MTNEHLPLCVKWRVNVHMCVCVGWVTMTLLSKIPIQCWIFH